MKASLSRVPLLINGQKILFDPLTLDQAGSQVLGDTCQWKMVVTPNVHHLHLLRKQPELLPLYQKADLLLADGWPVAWLLNRRRRSAITRVTGADLLEKIIDTPGRGRPMVLIGGESLDVLSTVGKRAQAAGWSVHLEPAPKTEMQDCSSREDLISRVAQKGQGGIMAIGVGAPNQEKLAQAIRDRPGHGYILCVGMAINFSAGYARRAPEFVQQINMEWAYRIYQEPTRLFLRYVQNLMSFAPIVLENVRKNRCL